MSKTMKTKGKFNFSDFSVGDIATVYRPTRPLLPAHISRYEVTAITNDTLSVTNKYSCRDIVFASDGKEIDNGSYELMHLEKRSNEEKLEQQRLKEEYREAADKHKALEEKTHAEMMALLKPFIEYVQKNDVRFTLDTMFSIDGYPPRVNLTINRLPTTKEKDRLFNLIDP